MERLLRSVRMFRETACNMVSNEFIFITEAVFKTNYNYNKAYKVILFRVSSKTYLSTKFWVL